MRIGSQSTNPQTPYLSKKTRQPPELGGCPLAEKEGFEPSRQLPQPTPLAGAVGFCIISVLYWILVEYNKPTKAYSSSLM